jgi:hypothetical protein
MRSIKTWTHLVLKQPKPLSGVDFYKTLYCVETSSKLTVKNLTPEITSLMLPYKLLYQFRNQPFLKSLKLLPIPISVPGGPMTLEEFLESVKNSNPSRQLSETLRSLWWDKKGDWDKAHAIAQTIPSAQGSAVHAYLHRKEGVLWNADYWYARAGRNRPSISLDEEWRQLTEEMLDKFEE